MNISDIRAVISHQSARQIERVEIRSGRDHVRSVIRLRGESPADIRPVQTGGSVPVPDAGCSANTTVKAESLGIFRRSHPARASACIEAGDYVVAGQPLALLQVHDVYTAVVAPCEGVIEDVLAVEGDRIDYGRPLFTVRPEAQ